MARMPVLVGRKPNQLTKAVFSRVIEMLGSFAARWTYTCTVAAAAADPSITRTISRSVKYEFDLTAILASCNAAKWCDT
jgi:hypothetical protein